MIPPLLRVPFFSLACVATVLAQTAPTGPHSADAAGASPTPPPVQLSVFEVTADQDVGYQAGNTASGSRFNTSLKDTAAAVQVFTPEFLSDFSVNSLADMIAYAPNMAADMLDTAADANPQFLGGSDLRDTRIRVRGLSASTALDFFETGIPVDVYNTERLELSSGPNSILFGFGSPGGLVNILTKRAQTQRTRSSVRLQTGQWAFQRAEVDHNQVIVPGKLAVRLNGLYQDSQGWRTYDYNDTTRGAVSVRFTPTPATSLLANFENGQVRSHATRPINAYDALLLWQARGSPLRADSAWVTADRANGVNRNTTARALHVTDAAGAAPFTLTLSNAANLRLLESTYEDLNVPVADRAGLTLASWNQIPYSVSTYGPGSSRDHNFDRLVVTAEHRFTRDLTVELAWNRERTTQLVRTVQGNQLSFAGDPNTVIPNPNGSTTPIPNPNAGRRYLEGRWVADDGAYTVDALRASVAWALDLGRFGRHRLAGLAEGSELRSWRYPMAQILVDENGVPFANAANPENAANFVWRRQYVAPSRFETYYGGNGQDSFNVTRNGRTFRPTWVNVNTAGGDILRTMRTLLAATQSSFWDNRIIVTAGVRYDRIRFDQHGERRFTASDPEVRSGRRLLNEVSFSRVIDDTTRHAPVTSTQGIVFHATKVASLFYNHGTNNSQPPLNARVLPDERLPEPFEGVTDDAGFMLNLLDGRVFVRATAFRTHQNKAAGGTFVINLNTGENNLVAPTTRILDTLLATGRINAAEYSAHLIGDEANLIGTSDVHNRGFELSTWFNLSRNLTGILNGSYTETDRSRVVPEFETWFSREREFWLRTPGAGSLVNPTSNSTLAQEAAGLERIMEGTRDFYGFGYGERPWKVNGSVRHSFSEGRLRGIFLGGGARWQSEPKLGREVIGRTASGNRIFGRTIHGPVDFKVDAFVGYRRKVSVLRRNADFSVQVNVTNLTGEDELMPLRYNPFLSGYARVLLAEPRKFRLTASLGW